MRDHTAPPRLQVLGRSCSFLQGQGTASYTLGEIREALRDRRPITRILLNYAKDGACPCRCGRVARGQPAAKPSPTPRVCWANATAGSPFYNLLTLAPVLGRESVKSLKRRMQRARAARVPPPNRAVESRLPDAVAALQVGSDDEGETLEEDRRLLASREESDAEPLFFAGLQVDVTDYPDLPASALQLGGASPAGPRRGRPSVPFGQGHPPH